MAEPMHAQRNDREADEMARQAYNAAFEELGLSWHWDTVTYAGLPARGRDGLRAYLQQEQAHLLRAYEADFLVDAIETAKSRCQAVMARNRAHAPWYAQTQQPSALAAHPG